MLPWMLHTPVLAGDGGGAEAEAEGGEQQSIPRTHQLNQPAKTAEAKVKMKTTTLGTRLMNGLLGGPTRLGLPRTSSPIRTVRSGIGTVLLRTGSRSLANSWKVRRFQQVRLGTSRQREPRQAQLPAKRQRINRQRTKFAPGKENVKEPRRPQPMITLMMQKNRQRMMEKRVQQREPSLIRRSLLKGPDDQSQRQQKTESQLLSQQQTDRSHCQGTRCSKRFPNSWHRSPLWNLKLLRWSCVCASGVWTHAGTTSIQNGQLQGCTAGRQTKILLTFRVHYVSVHIWFDMRQHWKLWKS